MTTDWTGALRRVSPTPEGFQNWVDTSYALELLRCSEEQITQLRSSGIQTHGDSFDRSDLWNVGLYSGTRASRPEMEMIFFSMVVSPRRDWLSRTEYAMSLTATCPNGSDCASDRWEPPQISGVAWHGGEPMVGEARWIGEIAVSGHQNTVRDTKVQEIWADFVNGHSFHYLFMHGEQTPSLTRARRVGDCMALSAALSEELLSQGFSSRVRDGFLFAGREARIHRWVEFEDDDGDWKQLDPSMAVLARTFFTPEYADFCKGSSLNRLVKIAGEDTFHVHHWCTEKRMDILPALTLRRS